MVSEHMHEQMAHVYMLRAWSFSTQAVDADMFDPCLLGGTQMVPFLFKDRNVEQKGDLI